MAPTAAWCFLCTSLGVHIQPCRAETKLQVYRTDAFKGSNDSRQQQLEKKTLKTITAVLIRCLVWIFNLVINYGFCSSLPNSTSLSHNSRDSQFAILVPQLSIDCFSLASHYVLCYYFCVILRSIKSLLKILFLLFFFPPPPPPCLHCKVLLFSV